MDAGLYRVPKGLMQTSNPKFLSWLPMLSVKQLPSMIILSSYDIPTLHFSSATGVCSFTFLHFIFLQNYQKYITFEILSVENYENITDCYGTSALRLSGNGRDRTSGCGFQCG